MSKPGITKSQGYLARVFCVEYDLKGMIDAYGIDFMHTLLDAVASGKVNCKQSVERWSAHVAMQSITELDLAIFDFNDDEDLAELINAA